MNFSHVQSQAIDDGKSVHFNYFNRAPSTANPNRAQAITGTEFDLVLSRLSS